MGACGSVEKGPGSRGTFTYAKDDEQKKKIMMGMEMFYPSPFFPYDQWFTGGGLPGAWICLCAR